MSKNTDDKDNKKKDNNKTIAGNDKNDKPKGNKQISRAERQERFIKEQNIYEDLLEANKLLYTEFATYD